MQDNVIFNKMADYYDLYRPNYPNVIIRQIVERAGLHAGSRVLEIGAGSGKATAQLVDYGCEILCIEPGRDLAEKGQSRFVGKKVNYCVALFEECNLPEKSFDAIISAQAFHWVKKPDGYALCAQALRDRGFLLPFWNIEVIRNSAIDQEIYELICKYDAYTAVLQEDAYQQRVDSIVTDIECCGFFSRPEVIQVERELCFTAEQYYGYAMTGNKFIKQKEEKRQAFYEKLKELELRYDGLRRTFISELYIAEKVS